MLFRSQAGDGILLRNISLFCGDFYHFGKQTQGQEFCPQSKVDTGGDQNQHKQREPQGTSAGQGDGDEIAP